jgi:NADPH:quinone reductase-like Zn-dependent oxidoreductase
VDTVVALVADAEAPGHVSRREVEAPVPAANEAVVEVHAVSLNRGEVRTLQTAPDGWRPGWDVAGVVAGEASDGTGPPVGSRVVGLAPGGGWAERVALATNVLSVLPDGVNFAAAATLPVAGLTALRALEVADTIDGHAVAVTGASGGVGRFAIQLAAQLGARVDAMVSTPNGAVPCSISVPRPTASGSRREPPTTSCWSQWADPRWPAPSARWPKAASS